VRKSYNHAAIIEQYENRGLPGGLQPSSLRLCTNGEKLLHRFITKPRGAEQQAV
jgi:hypothetical protein